MESVVCARAARTRLQPMKPAPPVINRGINLQVGIYNLQRERNKESRRPLCKLSLVNCRLSDGRALGILQREPKLLRQRVDGRAAALPRAVGLEPQIADAASPRRDDAADGAEVAAIRVLLIQAPDHVGR